MQKKKMLQEFLGHRFLVFALFMLIFSGGCRGRISKKENFSTDS